MQVKTAPAPASVVPAAPPKVAATPMAATTHALEEAEGGDAQSSTKSEPTEAAAKVTHVDLHACMDGAFDLNNS